MSTKICLQLSGRIQGLWICGKHKITNNGGRYDLNDASIRKEKKEQYESFY